VASLLFPNLTGSKMVELMRERGGHSDSAISGHIRIIPVMTEVHATSAQLIQLFSSAPNTHQIPIKNR